MNVAVDVSPTRPYAGTTLVSCLHPLMQAVNRPEWSMARLQGVLGHAFHFEMKKSGDWVMHDSLDWGSKALELLPQLARWTVFHVTNQDTEVDRPAFMQEAREAARDSLARGIPALVWQPMTPEMRADNRWAVSWGLIVGYNERDETYTVRHPNLAEEYTIRYDALGQTDGAGLISVRVFSRLNDTEPASLHRAALQNAVALANGAKYGSGGADSRRGFGAYELWREVFDSDEIPVEPSRNHAEVLWARRTAASEYLRELIALYPDTARPLGEGAAHFECEVEAIDEIRKILGAAVVEDPITPEDRSRIGAQITEALEYDRAAIQIVADAPGLR